MVMQSLAKAMGAQVAGSGTETLVLAHGFGTGRALWDNIIPSLAEKYRVVSFDWNFAGAYSEEFDGGKYTSLEDYAVEVLGMLEEIGVDECVFVGHSMSAMVGCIASVKRPELFKHLILIGASPRYLNDEGYIGGFEREDVDQIFTSIETDIQRWASNFAPLILGKDGDPTLINTLRGWFGSMRPDAALAVAKIIFLGDYRDRVGEVATPCTIVSMKNDIAVPECVAYFIQKRLKGKSSVEVMDVNGHFPMLTAPDLLVEVIDRAMAMAQLNIS